MNLGRVGEVPIGLTELDHDRIRWAMTRTRHLVCRVTETLDCLSKSLNGSKTRSVSVRVCDSSLRVHGRRSKVI